MTPEESVVRSAVQAWKLNVDRADKLFSGLTEHQLLNEVAPGRNRLVYIWGHLIAVHDGMLPLLDLGPRLHPDLDAPFLKGTDKAVTDIPPAADLKRRWDEVNARLIAGFSAFTPADWVKKHTIVSDEDFAANPLRNRLSILLSRTSHIAYHLGQAVLVNK
jgi:DinB superfamily